MEINNEKLRTRVIYEALFVFELDDYDVEYPEWVQRVAPLNEATLDIGIGFPHITVAYKPLETHERFYGRTVHAITDGYGNDGINEGYSIDLIPERWLYGDGSNFDDFCSLFAAEQYHMTISVSENGRPVDTGKLKFSALPINKRHVFECHFGAFVEMQYSDGTVKTAYTFSRS